MPFGEYLPFEKFFSRLGLTKIVGIEGSFATGDGPHTLIVPADAPTGGTVIRILFPGEVVGALRPNWFVNVTDRILVRLPACGRALPSSPDRARARDRGGIPVARAANTGISAVIDPLGRVRARLDLNRAGVLITNLPAVIDPTPYSRSGWYVFWLLLSACAVAARLGCEGASGA